MNVWAMNVTARRVRWWVWGGLVVPFVVAAVTLWTRHWYPVLDLAMTEFRVRDVGTSDTPLIGLPGRIGRFPEQGSHPGPLSFYLVAPTYRLVGASAWGLLLGAIVVAVVAIGTALWIAERRGGPWLVCGVGALLAFMVRGYGFEVVTQPWNPYLPVLMWLVVLLATWSVLDGDGAMIVVVAAVASLCAQTHMPYLGLGLGMGALAVGSMAVRAWRDPSERRAVLRWWGIAGLVTAVLWTPPVIDQFRNEPGNLSMLVDYFRTPPEEPVGLLEGLRLFARHLDITRLGGAVTGADGFVTRAAYDLEGSVLPGLVLAVLWVGAAVFAVRARHRALMGLHAVLAWSVLLGAFSMGRIFGKVWFYLTLWAWWTTALMVVSVLWTGWIWARDRASHPLSRRVPAAVMGVVGVGSLLALTVEAGGAAAPEQHLSDTLRSVVGPTVEGLDEGVGAATGRDGTYLVTWSDARNFGSQGYGLVSELERRGYDVGVLDPWRVPVTPQRVVPPGAATAELRLVTGRFVDETRALPGAVELAYVDPRTSSEVDEYDQLADEVRSELVAAGLDDLVPLLESNLFGLQIAPGVTPRTQSKVDRMLSLGGPTAVFVLPPAVTE
jgi:hypothetical protein